MADRHPSAIKRNRQSERRRVRNQAVKSAIKTSTKKFVKAITELDWQTATELLRETSSKLDRAGTRRVIHRNLASRRKSRLALFLKRAQAEAASAPQTSKRIATKTGRAKSTGRSKRKK